METKKIIISPPLDMPTLNGRIYPSDVEKNSITSDYKLLGLHLLND